MACPAVVDPVLRSCNLLQDIVPDDPLYHRIQDGQPADGPLQMNTLCPNGTSLVLLMQNAKKVIPAA